MEKIIPVSGGPTKPEVLAIALSKLELRPGDTFLDIGCGTASVSIAAAKQCPGAGINIIAIDDRPEAVSAAKENCANSGFGDRIIIIQGEAANVLNDIEKADCAFIGGSRNIEAVLDAVASKVRRTVVVNAVRIETAARIITHMKTLGIFHEALHVQVSKSCELAGETYFKPDNPVYIIVGNTSQVSSAKNTLAENTLIKNTLTKNALDKNEIAGKKMNDIPVLIGIGLGPGDPKLLTLAAIEALRNCDTVFVPGTLAAELVAPYTDCEILEFPMTKDTAVLNRHWEENAKKVGQAAQKGTTGFGLIGDANFFSTFTHLKRKVRQIYPDIEIKTIPGVSSITAFASKAGIALESSFLVTDSTPVTSKIILKANRPAKMVDELKSEGYTDFVFAQRLFMDGETITNNPDEIPEKGNYFSILYARKKDE